MGGIKGHGGTEGAGGTLDVQPYGDLASRDARRSVDRELVPVACGVRAMPGRVGALVSNNVRQRRA